MASQRKRMPSKQSNASRAEAPSMPELYWTDTHEPVPSQLPREQDLPSRQQNNPTQVQRLNIPIITDYGNHPDVRPRNPPRTVQRRQPTQAVASNNQNITQQNNAATAKRYPPNLMDQTLSHVTVESHSIYTVERTDQRTTVGQIPNITQETQHAPRIVRNFHDTTVVNPRHVLENIRAVKSPPGGPSPLPHPGRSSFSLQLAPSQELGLSPAAPLSTAVASPPHRPPGLFSPPQSVESFQADYSQNTPRQHTIQQNMDFDYSAFLDRMNQVNILQQLYQKTANQINQRLHQNQNSEQQMEDIRSNERHYVNQHPNVSNLPNQSSRTPELSRQTQVPPKSLGARFQNIQDMHRKVLVRNHNKATAIQGAVTKKQAPVFSKPNTIRQGLLTTENYRLSDRQTSGRPIDNLRRLAMVDSRGQTDDLMGQESLYHETLRGLEAVKEQLVTPDRATSRGQATNYANEFNFREPSSSSTRLSDRRQRTEQQMSDSFAELIDQSGKVLITMIEMANNLRASIIATANEYDKLLELMEKFNVLGDSGPPSPTLPDPTAQEVPQPAGEADEPRPIPCDGLPSGSNPGNEASRQNRPERIVLPPEYDPNDSRWALRYQADSPNLFELEEGSGVYVNAMQLKRFDRAKGCYCLVQLLLPEIFSNNALMVCATIDEETRGDNARPQLDKEACRVLMRFVVQHALEKGWNVDAPSIISGIDKKILQMRKLANADSRGERGQYFTLD